MRIFISYRRADSADVSGRIYDRLIDHFGRGAVFKDVDNIPLGQDFKKHLQKMLANCAAELVIIGPQWTAIRDQSGARRLSDARDFVRLEVEVALQRDIPVIPVLVMGAAMPDAEDLPASLAGLATRQGVKIRPDPDFHRDMGRLIKGLEAYVTPAPSTTRGQALVPSRRAANESGGATTARRWWPLSLMLVALAGLSLTSFEVLNFWDGIGLSAVASLLVMLGYLFQRRWIPGFFSGVVTMGFVYFFLTPSALPPAGILHYLFAGIPIFLIGPLVFLWALRDALRKTG